MEYQGNGISGGIAIGQVLLYEPFTAKTVEDRIPANGEIQAVTDYEQAVRRAAAELERIRQRLASQDAVEANIFAAQAEILQDTAMDEEIRNRILLEKLPPAQAVSETLTAYAEILAQAPDPLIQERAADLRDVCGRLLRCLAGEEERNLATLEAPAVIVAHDLLPSDTATLDREKVLAIVTETGGPTSHSAIIAKSYGIPAVLGIPDICHAVRNGQTVIVDADSGSVLTQAPEKTLEAYRRQAALFAAQRRKEAQFLTADPITPDGVRIEVNLNIGAASEQELTHAEHTDGAGLFRTEFLYLDRAQAPDEEEQYRIYRHVLERFGTRPVILRTLDIGGDKQAACLPLPKEQNPFLGNRALRFCLSHPPLFLTQLRAALRAGQYGNLWIMFPMVSSLEDIRRAKAMVEQAKAELTAHGTAFSNHVKLGIMIEIPSLAIIAGKAAEEVDFASIGTNDLTQYLLAADRGEPSVAAYYQMYHPAVLRTIRMTAAAFAAAEKPLCVCGELGGELPGGVALIGLGLRRLSMGGSSVAAMKRMICGLTVERAKAAAEQACSAETAEQARIVLAEAAQCAIQTADMESDYNNGHKSGGNCYV